MVVGWQDGSDYNTGNKSVFVFEFVIVVFILVFLVFVFVFVFVLVIVFVFVCIHDGHQLAGWAGLQHGVDGSARIQFQSVEPDASDKHLTHQEVFSDSTSDW